MAQNRQTQKMTQKKLYQNTLLQNRNHLTGRQSMESLMNYARQHDQRKIISKIRMARASIFVSSVFLLPPIIYLLYHSGAGYWRNIYPTSVLTSFLQVPQSRVRQYFTPEIYLKDQQKQKYEIHLKQVLKIKNQANNSKQ